MKTHQLFALLVCVSTASCQDRLEVNLVYSVKDDLGMPLGNVQIDTQMFDYWNPGGGAIGGDKYKLVPATTKADGTAIMRAATSRCELVIMAKKEGFYNGGNTFRSTTRNKGVWEPFGHTIPMLLKRIRNPIALKAKMVASLSGWLELPADVCSYDFDVGDWVAPHGKGVVSDVTLSLEGGRYVPEKMKPVGDWRLVLSFSNPLDGLVVHDSAKDLPSAMLMPYLAPDSGYLPSKTWHRTAREGPMVSERPTNRTTSDYSPTEHLFLRVRTHVDEDGKITSANYAKVHRGFEWTSTGKIKFQYHYNPTPNDRNLEFDPKRNLFPAPTNERDRRNSPPPVMEP